MRHPAIPLLALTLSVVIFFLFESCSTDRAEPREIRGHSLEIDGISHANGAFHPERLCQDCHGASLQGGEKGEPSCYTCHGLNWDASDPETSLAPSDHTVMNGIFLHRPGHTSPVGTCDTCHGADLNGDSGYPSCFLCHDQNW